MKKMLLSVFIILLFGWFNFFRFYKLEDRYQFTWDQIENAWVMKAMIVDSKFPIKGMEAKATSGFSIGPGFYYLLFPFFVVLNLNPIAGGIFSGIISIFMFVALLYCFARIAGLRIAIFSILLYTFSFHIISFDRIAWPVVMIPFVSLIIFYSWWNILLGNVKYYVLLGLGIGCMFHLHMTVVYMLLISLIMTPFLPWLKKGNSKYMFIGFCVTLVFILPMIVSYFVGNVEQSSNFSKYIAEQFHGLHLRRVFQLLPDMLIEFSGILNLNYGKYIYPFLWLMSVVFIYKRWNLKHTLLVCSWFLIPLFVMSLYKGEISQYYFSTTRVVTVFLLGVIISEVIKIHSVVKFVSMSIIIIFMIQNVNFFMNVNNTNYRELKEQAKSDVENKKIYHFTMGDPYSYIHEWMIYSSYQKWPKGSNWVTFDR